MATKLQIYNGALRRLSNPRLTSLTQEVSYRYFLDGVWDEGMIDYLLSRGKWSFAQRTLKMFPSTTLIPQFGFKFAYPLPIDYIFLSALWQDERSLVPLLRYKLQAGVIYSDFDVIYLTYTSNDDAFGGNYAIWPAMFTQYAQAYMASQAQPLISNSNTTDQDLTKDLVMAERMALTSDGLSKPIQISPIGSWGRARLNAQPSYTGIMGATVGTGL